MARLDPVGKMIFSDHGVLQADADDVEALKNLWLLYHFYVASVADGAPATADPQDVLRTERAN